MKPSARLVDRIATRVIWTVSGAIVVLLVWFVA
jgi:hypothetical protein